MTTSDRGDPAHPEQPRRTRTSSGVETFAALDLVAGEDRVLTQGPR
ncbi:hypothetical protein [Streptomyces europaeiscabiei]|nr:hypothetical protein OHB30_14850 [Streptomyces europaeiscabiei]